MKSDIIFFSRIQNKQSGGGGCRRESQLHDILNQFQFEFISVWDTKWYKNPLSQKDALFLSFNKRFNPIKKYWHPFYHDYVFRMRAVSKDWMKLIKKRKKVKLVFIDDPIYFAPLVRYLSKRKIPVIGLCQNIESLSYNQLNPEYQQKFFSKEISLLKKCRLNITISQEETFILKNFNIPSFYLPYYPISMIEKNLLQIKEKRKKTKKAGFLIIGNAWNRVTLEGMKKFIKLWDKHCSHLKHDKLLVAGFGTDRLLSRKKCDNIEYLGEISNQELDDVTIRIKGMICYQDYGSGALTKIKEMLIAGVPILANHHSARSYREYKSIIKFSEFSEFLHIIKQWDTIEKNTDTHFIKPRASLLIKRIYEQLNASPDPSPLSKGLQ